jgi:hypothetical protein
MSSICNILGTGAIYVDSYAKHVADGIIRCCRFNIQFVESKYVSAVNEQD